MGVLAEVAATQLHARMAGVQNWKLLATALFLNGAQRPQSGLRVVCVNLSAEASRECPDEMPPSRHRDQIGACEGFSSAIAIEIASGFGVPFEFERHRGRLAFGHP